MESLNAAQSALNALRGIITSRLELFSLETVIEKRKAVLLFGSLAMVAAFTLITFIFAGILLILSASPSDRVLVAFGWMLLNAILAITFGVVVALALRKGAAPYTHTREEIRKDFECLATVVK